MPFEGFMPSQVDACVTGRRATAATAARTAETHMMQVL